ncbi:PQQ-dependent sugar dehydrogenase [Profundibacterium mesophilum]|uniref:L-sorbosone dehydrogenase n=1 Tax=Profundibacterium mesophilum KAUST100406-0324 TaxID=1037889 RepID=A0A921TBQ9_9RHOB|nr:sorbosone dehydrogenase family protein [Profundibacterium mesophilum]KAF0676080.1 putative L-sorbosone dehydrogenase [Profundibacterium mesophilum KAUST100406-0324]
MPRLRNTRRLGALFGGALALFALAGCGREAAAPNTIGVGPSPALPAPRETVIPTVNIAPARGWAEGQMPSPAAGLAVTRFAAGLDHPRWLYALPNGDVLVAESNAQPKPPKGLRDIAMRIVMGRAGAATPSADRISILRDGDGDGIAENRGVFLDGLTSPIGMALVGSTLYIANTDGIVTVPYRTGMTRAEQAPEPFFPLPAGPINQHWTKTLVASPDGRTLYVGIGSNSNAGENGMEAEQGRAAIWRVDIASGQGALFANGLRNPVGLDIDRSNGKLYAVVNERDALGDNLVPDYLTSVREGAFYGWPYSYFGQNIDPRPKPRRPDLVAAAVAPDYGLGSHVAPLGLDISDRPQDGIAARYGRGAFIGLHGSWNRRPRVGYEVVFVPFDRDGPTGRPATVLGGFLDGEEARGRPVGVILDERGGLLVADDVGNVVWRVSMDARGAGEGR